LGYAWHPTGKPFRPFRKTSLNPGTFAFAFSRPFKTRLPVSTSNLRRSFVQSDSFRTAAVPYIPDLTTAYGNYGFILYVLPLLFCLYESAPSH